MFGQALDMPRAVVLWFFSGTSSDRDLEEYLLAIATMDAMGATFQRPVAVQYHDPNCTPPTAPWRKRIADASTAIKSQALFCLVSPSPLIRGVVTAINWLRPPSFEFTTCATIEDAADWIADRRGYAGGNLQALLAEARTDAERRARGPASSR